MCNEFENIEPVVPLYENIHNGYQVTTIAKILNRINKDLFIPAIQRPYVWSPEQVVSLFDSLMSGYPIGALMIWNRPPNNPDNWKIYKFIKDFIKRNIHNDLYNIDENQPVSLVLDGQQRLTTLLIGLQGTYTYGAGRNPPKKILYLNLAYLPHILDENIIEDDDINPIAAHYNFEFFDNNIIPPNRHGKIWFRVSNILGMVDLLSLEQQIN